MRIFDLHQDVIETHFFSTRMLPGFSRYNQHVGDMSVYVDAGFSGMIAAVWPYRSRFFGPRRSEIISALFSHTRYFQRFFGSQKHSSHALIKKNYLFNESKILSGANWYYQYAKEHDMLILDSDISYLDWKKEKKFGLLLHVEGVDHVQSIQDIDRLYEQGYRSVGLVWNWDNSLSGAAGSEMGLTDVGKEVVVYMQEKGMLVDAAHMSFTALRDTLYIAKKPILISHANMYGLYPHPRNVRDEELLLLPENGGVLGLSLVSMFYGPSYKNYSIDDFLQQVAYAYNLLGEEYIALGSDMHGVWKPVLLEGINHIQDLSVLYDRVVVRRGVGFAEKFFWGNTVRILDGVFL